MSKLAYPRWIAPTKRKECQLRECTQISCAPKMRLRPLEIFPWGEMSGNGARVTWTVCLWSSPGLSVAASGNLCSENQDSVTADHTPRTSGRWDCEISSAVSVLYADDFTTHSAYVYRNETKMWVFYICTYHDISTWYYSQYIMWVRNWPSYVWVTFLFAEPNLFGAMWSGSLTLLNRCYELHPVVYFLTGWCRLSARSHFRLRWFFYCVEPLWNVSCTAGGHMDWDWWSRLRSNYICLSRHRLVPAVFFLSDW